MVAADLWLPDALLTGHEKEVVQKLAGVRAFDAESGLNYGLPLN